MDKFYIVKVDYLKDDNNGVPRHKKATYAVKALSAIEAISNITVAKKDELKDMEVESVNKAHKVIAYYEQDMAHEDAKIYKLKVTSETTTANDKIIVTAEYLFVLANDSELAIQVAGKKFDTILEYEIPAVSATQILEVI